MEHEIILSCKSVVKSFGMTKALKGVSIEVFRGDIRGLIGENGSGKSTLSSIVAGVQPLDSGEMYFKGQRHEPKTMVEAQSAGVSMVVQESGAVLGISVAANIFLGKEERFIHGGILRISEMKRAAREALHKIHCDDIDPSVMMDKKDARAVDYFGYGPYESYADKHHCCYRGLFHGDVDSLFEDYARPQENGSHYGVQYLNVGDADGCGLQVVPETEPFSFNASRYTQETLEQTRHNYELIPARSTVVCIDYKQSGIGSNSCGPELLEKYQLCEKAFDFGVRLLPRV